MNERAVELPCAQSEELAPGEPLRWPDAARLPIRGSCWCVRLCRRWAVARPGQGQRPTTREGGLQRPAGMMQCYGVGFRAGSSKQCTSATPERWCGSRSRAHPCVRTLHGIAQMWHFNRSVWARAVAGPHRSGAEGTANLRGDVTSSPIRQRAHRQGLRYQAQDAQRG